MLQESLISRLSAISTSIQSFKRLLEPIIGLAHDSTGTKRVLPLVMTINVRAKHHKNVLMKAKSALVVELSTFSGKSQNQRKLIQKQLGRKA